MKRRDEVLVGIFTTVAVVLAIIGSIWLARGGLGNGYPLYARFPWGANLKQGQPVLLVGVSVGFVDDVVLRDDGTLITKFRILKKYQVPRGTTAAVIANGIFGDMAIALTPLGPNPHSFLPGDTVPIGPSQPSIATITARFDSISIVVKTITDATLRQLVDSGGIADLRLSLAATSQLSRQLQEVIAIQSHELQLTNQSVRRAVSAIDSAQIAAAITTIRTNTDKFGDVATDLRATMQRVNGVLAKVESGEGTLAKLLNDGSLYGDVRRVTASVDSLVFDFRQNPRRFVKLSIF